MNLIAEALLIWRIEYEQELESCDRWIKWCEEQNDTHGMNFHQGKRSAAVFTDISLHSLKELCEKLGGQPSGKSIEDLAKITVRAAGDVNCQHCGRKYKEHPMVMSVLYDGQPFLHQGCDGRMLKL